MLLQSVSKQWGYCSSRTATFPIPFPTAALFIVAVPKTTSTSATATGAEYLGTTSVNLYLHGTAGISLAAIEQWGNSWSGYTGVFNWYFPISPSQVYAACLTKHTKNISSSHNWEPARVEEWNNSYARIHPDGDLGYSVIAICKA